MGTERWEHVLIAVSIALVAWCYVVAAWKRQWAWLLGGLLIPGLGVVGAFLDPRGNSGWDSVGRGIRVGVPVGIVAAATLVALVFFPPSTERESKSLAALRPETARYLAADGRPTSGQPDLKGQRIVPVDSDEDEIDEGTFIHMPDQLQARSPDDVTMVLKIEHRKEVVGSYSSGGKAWQHFADLTFVDLKQRRRYEAVVEGGDPPSKKYGLGGAEGSEVEPTDISLYLDALLHPDE